MCDTLQLNWKLPTPPVDALSSPLSSIKDDNENILLNNNGTNSSLEIERATSKRNRMTNKI